MAFSRVPSPKDLLEFIGDAKGSTTRREIARAFNLKGNQRNALRHILAQLVTEGQLARRNKAYVLPNKEGGNLEDDALHTLEIIENISDRWPLGCLYKADKDGNGEEKESNSSDVFSLNAPPPLRPRLDRLRKGDIILARVKFLPSEENENRGRATFIRRLEKTPDTLIGTLMRSRGMWVLRPSDRNLKLRPSIDKDQVPKDLTPETLVQVSLKKNEGKWPGVSAKIIQVLGSVEDPSALSKIAILENNLPANFSQNALSQIKKSAVPPLDNREDLRAIPLVTIDGADARDFDDAVWAEKQENGFHLIVAIADVAHYVTPETHLDQEARERGNSTYLPDQVLPMLPEKLSNNLCSLRPNEDRACLAVHLWIDDHGLLKKHRFARGLMRSAHRLTYEQVEASHEKQDPKDPISALIEPLFKAYKALAQARRNRGTLEFEIPEPCVRFDDKGSTITGLETRVRLTSHKLIEEFMILANVAAAHALESKGAPCVYRTHDDPDPTKLEMVAPFLNAAGLFSKKGKLTLDLLPDLLERTKDTRFERPLHSLLLRSQARASYSLENVGHFGLKLDRYAHFTSPIRRYSDLLVHRSLIHALGLEDTSNPKTNSKEPFSIDPATPRHLSSCEDRSTKTERKTLNRHSALYMIQKIGTKFKGHVSGVTRSGLFVALEETGAEGLLPLRHISGDFFSFEERHMRLRGRRTGQMFTLGDALCVVLEEADPLTGSLAFSLPPA